MLQSLMESFGIRSMELKEEEASEEGYLVFSTSNPFNGIESLLNLDVIEPFDLVLGNPFNGIES